MGMTAEPVAALDCGTNSTRLLVADRAGNALVREMRIARLGEGVDATRRLDPGAVNRTLDVLREYRSIMDSFGVGPVRLVATSAVRDAENGDVFLESAGKVVGAPAELLSGLDEGRTAFAGATAELDPPPGVFVVVDIGGGSTELIVGRTEVSGVVSVDIGCVRLTERHLHRDPPAPGELAQARATIAAALEHAEKAVPELAALPAGSRLVGLAGTVSTLAMLELGLERYERDRVHHFVLRAEAVARWCSVLAAEPSAARALRPGVEPGREDVIVAGATVLDAVMARYRFAECVVSESDILDGLVAGLL
jgi:exopolyphosphatase/guanosine-5'-triphosphate,3'-diphosphate pyrophosphatase